MFIYSPGTYLIIRYNYINFLSKLFIFLLVLSLGLVYFFPYNYFFFFNFTCYIDPLVRYSLYLLGIKLIFFFFIILNKNFNCTRYKSNSYKIFNRFEVLLLFIFSFLGIIGIIISNDFLVLYLFLELQSLGLYLLAASSKYIETAIESGIKYFILGSFASSLFLFGLSFLYGFSGITTYNDLICYLATIDFSYFNQFNIQLLGILLILFGFLFKLAIFPFHQWLPDIYEGVDFLVVIYYILISKLSLIYFFIKFLLFIGNDLLLFYNNLILFCVIGSILMGSLSALFQFKLRKLLAFSSIVNMGYLILLLMLNNIFSIGFSIIFYINYICCILILLTIFYLQNLYIKSSYKLKSTTELDKFNVFLSFFRKDISISLLIIISLFSLFGLPPFLGFFSKFYILLVLFIQHYYLIISLIIFVSLLSVFYYLRLINSFYFNLNKFGWITFVSFSEFIAYSLIICCIIICSFIYIPDYLLFLSINLGLHVYI